MGGDTTGPLGAAYCITFPMADRLAALSRLGTVVDGVFNIKMAALAFLPATVSPFPFYPQFLAQLTVNQATLLAPVNGAGADLDRVIFLLQPIADLFRSPSIF